MLALSSPQEVASSSDLTKSISICMPKEERPIAPLRRKQRETLTFTKLQHEHFDIVTSATNQIDKKFATVLQNYDGPNVLVTSIKRSYNRKSKHFVGKAIDIDFSADIITYLKSEEGRKFITDFDLTVFIENNRLCSTLRELKKDSLLAELVFVNPNATGLHIHINMK